MLSCHQTHSDTVVLVDKNINSDYFQNTDGILTSNKNTAILTWYADCLPIFIYDEETKILSSTFWLEGSFQEIVKELLKKINLRIYQL